MRATHAKSANPLRCGVQCDPGFDLAFARLSRDRTIRRIRFYVKARTGRKLGIAMLLTYAAYTYLLYVGRTA